jgi:hypothetical protein
VIKVRKVLDCFHLFVADWRVGRCGGWLVDYRKEIFCRLDGDLVSGHCRYLGMLRKTFKSVSDLFRFGLVCEDSITAIMLHGGF